MASYDLIVKGGALVDATNVIQGDLCIRDGKVQAVVRDAAADQAAGGKEPPRGEQVARQLDPPLQTLK